MHKISSLNKFQRPQQSLLGPKRIKHIKIGWYARIKKLEEAIANY